MDLNKIFNILKNSTFQFRKGEEIIKEGNVIHHYMMPHFTEARGNLTMVDLHFIYVGVNREKAEKFKDDVIEFLDNLPAEYQEIIKGGANYIQMGGILGSQDLALMMFALGKVLGIWDIILPSSIGFTGEEADKMAGMGFIYNSGYKK